MSSEEKKFSTEYFIREIESRKRYLIEINLNDL